MKRLNDTYTMLGRLGSGGGGIVYKAYHERLRTYVVVKQIKGEAKELLDSRAEADILKNIKHSHLPRVYDFLEIDGEIYTVMDFIPGESLDKELDVGRSYDGKTVYRWALQLADALSYLHSQTPPVIHSDIKPSNIMLTPEGDVCLIDFNVSLAFDAAKRTSAGVSEGYSPPEQYQSLEDYLERINLNGTDIPVSSREQMAEKRKTEFMPESVESGRMAVTESMPENEKKDFNSDRKNPPTQQVIPVRKGGSGRRTENLVAGITGRGVDERSDIYSLGATLYHLLTGIYPSVDFGAIKPISKMNIKIGEGFQTIIEKMMDLDPDRRYQNGKELLYALEHVYELDSDYRRFRRNRRLYKGCAAVLLIAGAVMMGTGWFMMGRERLTAYNRAVEAAGLSIEVGNFDQAEQEIHKALELRTDRIEVYEREVLRLYSMGDYEAAITYGRDVINNPLYEIETESDVVVLGDIYYLLGNAYFELTDYMNASACFQEAVSRNRENGLYFRDYAITLAKTGNTEQAEKELDTAISLGLGQDSVYMAQGEISFARGEYSEAEESLQKAISYAESDSLRKRAVLLCDSVYQELGADYLDQEIAMLEQEEGRYGDSTSANSLTERLADAYVRKAEADESQRDMYFHMALEKFVGLYESGYVTRQLMENIAIIYEQLDEFDQAESVLIQMTERYPDSYVPYKRLAYLEADRQQVKENTDREYQTMKEYYDMAKELYGDQDGDQEMQMLDAMMQELRDGGWL